MRRVYFFTFFFLYIALGSPNLLVGQHLISLDAHADAYLIPDNKVIGGLTAGALYSVSVTSDDPITAPMQGLFFMYVDTATHKFRYVEIGESFSFVAGANPGYQIAPIYVDWVDSTDNSGKLIVSITGPTTVHDTIDTKLDVVMLGDHLISGLNINGEHRISVSSPSFVDAPMQGVFLMYQKHNGSFGFSFSPLGSSVAFRPINNSPQIAALYVDWSDVGDNSGTVNITVESMDPIAYYPFNGNTNDEGERGLHAINSGSTFGNDRFSVGSKALSVDGSTQYATVPYNTAFDFGTSSFSISAWFNATEIKTGRIVGKLLETPGWDSRWMLTLGDDSTISFHWANGSVSGDNNLLTSIKFKTQQWYHIVAVMDRTSTEARVYVNGSLNNSETSGISGSFDNADPLSIGRDPYYANAYFHGSLDDIRIYNRALSDSEIYLLYASFHKATIVSIDDIPNDQGGKVRVKWYRSFSDSAGMPSQVTSYGIWRKIPLGMMGKTKRLRPPFQIQNDSLGLYYDYLGTVNAVQSINYHFIAQTLADSSSPGTGDETFLITAHTNDPNMYYISDTETGHSVNNSIPVTVAEKWNMVSLPTHPPFPHKTVLFPSATSEAFGYSNGYAGSSQLETGRGYWLKFDQTEDIDIPGVPTDSLMIPVAIGWNMIGSLGQPLDIAHITSIPAGITTSPFFGYDNGYFSASSLLPGKAYWVKVNHNGYLILNGNVAVGVSTNRIHIVPSAELPPVPPLENLQAVEIAVPTEYQLRQNYPNPFNPTTTIRYGLPQESEVRLSVVNVLGQEVAVLAEGKQEAGWHEAVFDASELPSGVYFYRLVAGGFVETRKLLLMR